MQIYPKYHQKSQFCAQLQKIDANKVLALECTNVQLSLCFKLIKSIKIFHLVKILAGKNSVYTACLLYDCVVVKTNYKKSLYPIVFACVIN